MFDLLTRFHLMLFLMPLFSMSFLYGNSEEKDYDVIIVGAGTAGCIVATRLAEEHPSKHILLIDAGGPVSAKVGGSDRPPYFSTVEHGPTYSDIPGEYGFIFFSPMREKYMIKQSPMYFQGKGYGGTCEFNSMCCQVPPPDDFNSWPLGWKWKDLAPYFDRVLECMEVSTTSSADGKAYDLAKSDVVIALAKKNGIPEGDTLYLDKNKTEFYGRYSVASDNGERGGPISGYFQHVVDKTGKSKYRNFHLKPHCTVETVNFNKNQAVSVTYIDHEKSSKEVKLNESGILIMAAGSLNTPRILLLSGVGPKGMEQTIFGGATKRSFSIDNKSVGTVLHDHYMISILFKYTGYIPKESEKGKGIQEYVDSRIGPYAQYGPSLLLFGAAGSERRNFEIGVASTGVGFQKRPFIETRKIRTFTMPFYPKRRNFLQISKNGVIQKITRVEADDVSDIDTMALAIQKLIKWLLIASDMKIFEGPQENQTSIAQIKDYILTSKKMINAGHVGGGCPLANRTGTNPKTLIVDGTENVYVVDGSLIPNPLGAHPVLTIMALAEKAADIIGQQLKN